MLTFSILRITHGVEGLTCQKKWQTRILEWRQMDGIFMLSLVSTAHSADHPPIATLC
jgi:hypothetical protein